MSALKSVERKRLFMIVTCEVSKHLIVSLSEEFSNNFSLAFLSFKTTLAGQGDWVIWGVGSWEVSGVDLLMVTLKDNRVKMWNVFYIFLPMDI